MPSIITEIRKPKARIFRRLFVKRRLSATGLFESTWQDISKDVKKWGHISKSIDYVRYSKVRFNDVAVVMANDYGRYNPETDSASFWSGYASQQRSLVKIETGFVHQTEGSSKIWTNTEYPTDTTAFLGIVQGDLFVSDENQVTFTIKPLLQVFRDFYVRNLTGYTTTGMTAKQFITMLRDQTDGSSSFIFRPFFSDTTTFWNFTSSSVVYADIANTVASARPIPAGDPVPQNDFIEMNVWDVLEKLGEAENLVPYITRTGTFTFSHRDPNTTTAAYEFFGRGFAPNNYGTTIKKINRYGRKISDYYSRVEVKWLDSATTTAVVTTQTAMVVNGTNTAWLYGHRTFKVENFWIATLTSANTLALNIFNNVSTLKDEVDFTTSYVPHLELLDRVQISYETSEKGLLSRWDVSDWATNTITSDLIWDLERGDAIRFSAKEFKLVSIDLDLDGLETRFVGIAI